MATVTEAARIRAEYARRSEEVPVDLYSPALPVNQFSRTQLTRTLLALLSAEGVLPLTDQKILDVGCGTGSWLLEFLHWGAAASSLAGIDLIAERTTAAQARLPQSQIVSGNATRLPWPSASFDLVSQFVVFTSILDEVMRVEVANEMLRVVKPDGVILWYDFRRNNPRNPNVRRVESAEIAALFPGCSITLKSVTLAPPIARAVVPVNWIAGLVLEKLPFLRTHYVGIIRKRGRPLK